MAGGVNEDFHGTRAALNALKQFPDKVLFRLECCGGQDPLLFFN